MRITAHLDHAAGEHRVVVSTDGREQRLAVAARATGPGSAVNGGELLCLAVATCYCNDVFREAKKRGVAVERVIVDVEAEFGGAGEPAGAITYRVRLAGGADGAALGELARQVDAIAEVQGTLRRGVSVVLADVDVDVDVEQT